MVNIEAKIIDICSPQVVGTGKKKQEVIIGDKTSTAKLTLWENYIDSLTLSQSYSMKRLHVRVFNDYHSLLLPATGYVIDEIDDIPDATEVITEETEDQTLDRALWY